MPLGKLLQLLGLLWVTFVMVRSFLVDPSMLFQFGGLALGAAVFLVGRSLETKGK
ncbi:MAG TPA: hypothetical protein VFY71_09035 [Planctomycetota bacterium]|nr:hypothetical protein [Planctomycetota bacterium]